MEQNRPLDQDSDLPLQVVDRAPPGSGQAGRGRRTGVLRRFFRVLPFLLPIPVIIAGIGIVALYFQPPGLQVLMRTLNLEPGGGTSRPIAISAPVPEVATASMEEKVIGLGTLLPKGEVRIVAAPYGAADARIAQLMVGEGDPVHQGDVLAILDNEAHLKAALASAEAQVAARKAVLDQTRVATGASLAEASAALKREETTLANAETEYRRIEDLHQRGFATKEALDQKRTARDAAAREVDRLRATLSRYQPTASGEQADIEVAMSNLVTAQAELRQAEEAMNNAYVRAPIDGTVLRVQVRPGERPGTQGILDLGDIDTMIAKVEIYQSQIGKVRLGAQVRLSAEALREPLQGTVERIGLEVRQQSLVDASPAANTDARVVEVWVTLDAPSSQQARGLTNLQVVAEIQAPVE